MLKKLGFGFLTEPYNPPVVDSASPAPEKPKDFSASKKKTQAPAPPKSVQHTPAEPALPPLNTLKSWTLAEREDLLKAISDEAESCQRCPLHLGRSKALAGVGNPHAELVFVAAEPTVEEDRHRELFAGETGELTKKIIGAMTFSLEEIYLMTAVKCAPIKGRPPSKSEVKTCHDYLRRQLEIIQPKVLVVFGPLALESLLPETASRPFSEYRGRWLKYRGVELMPTHHPATIVKNVNRKRQVWDDMKLVMEKFGRKPPK